jgi:hypothetical protein
VDGINWPTCAAGNAGVRPFQTTDLGQRVWLTKTLCCIGNKPTSIATPETAPSDNRASLGDNPGMSTLEQHPL